MAALSTLFPVFFMVLLGIISRIKGFVTPEQKEGANNIVFNVLFPILIFNILLTSKIESSAILIVVYVFIAFVLTMFIGKLFTKFTGERFSHISYFMLTTCEGGNVALPLYTSIVG
ncbi:MAG: AEC family transporter, partial [Coprobacillus cateniformis]